MQTQKFAGADKTNTSFLSPLERRLAPVVVPWIPNWLETHHLTMLTLLWSGLIVVFSYFAAQDLRWLWGVSVMIALQWVTDFFDGKVGKYRNTGLVRWGYYMDHLLDYFFLASILIGYSFILPEKSHFQLLLMLALFAAYDFSTFLAYAAMDRLKISYLKFGPTEFRVALIIINTLLIAFGTKHMAGGLKWVNAGAVVGLCFLIYTTQKKIWRLDMEVRRREQPEWSGNRPQARGERLLEKPYVPAKECTY
ncbi:MAG TPA: CDP-alcohol phosphatidyltransferase family protein [Pyrinomonadaceae bacterium]|nr:CDP-alcohol phosphatidyltransferase family protein [Pyrinomonadaceae bacterium]